MLHSMGVKTNQLVEIATFVGHELPSKYLKGHLGKQARARRQAERSQS